MADFAPPLVTELVWSSERRFDVRSGPISFTLDGDTTAGPSPTQLLAAGLAGCMSIDVVDILRKGRQPVTSFTATLTGCRLANPPRRFVSFHLECRIGGDLLEQAAQRAIDLSRDKYCSVWQSLRQDIELTTAITIHR
jgi:putative redox protein